MSHKCPYDIYPHKHVDHMLRFFHMYLHMLELPQYMAIDMLIFHKDNALVDSKDMEDNLLHGIWLHKHDKHRLISFHIFPHIAI